MVVCTVVKVDRKIWIFWVCTKVEDKSGLHHDMVTVSYIVFPPSSAFVVVVFLRVNEVVSCHF